MNPWYGKQTILDQLQPTELARIAIVDGGLNHNSPTQYQLADSGHTRINTTEPITGESGHGAESATIAYSPWVRMVDVQVYHHLLNAVNVNDAIDGLAYAASVARIVNCGMWFTGSSGWGGLDVFFNTNDALCFSTAGAKVEPLSDTNVSWPAQHRTERDGTLKPGQEWAIAVGGLHPDTLAPTSSWSATRIPFAALSNSTSMAPPVAAGIAGMLLAYEPTLKGTEIFDLLATGAFQHQSIEQYSQFGIVNHLRTFEALLGRSLSSTVVTLPGNPDPIPDTEPDPQPESPMYTESVSTTFGTFSTKQPFNTNGAFGPEGLAQGLDGWDHTKALAFFDTITLYYTYIDGVQPRGGIGARTGNDFPNRDFKSVTLTMKDGTELYAEFTQTEERLAPIEARVNFDPANLDYFTVQCHDGNIIQFSELYFLPPAEEPPVEEPPVVDPPAAPRKAVKIVYDDNSEQIL